MQNSVLVSPLAKFITTIFLIFSLFNLTTANAAIVDWQKSVTIRLNNQSDTYILASLNEAKQTNANWIAITPGWLTDSKTSSNVVTKAGTPTDAKLIYTIQQAHNLGFKVMLKPHLDIKSGGWRGFLKPTNIDAFFTNYKAMILHYAEIAKAQNVEQFSVGAELVLITTDKKNEQKWRNLIADIRKVYSGKLTYSANADYGIYNETVLPFWDALDVIGLSMYRGLSTKENPTVNEMINGWANLDSNFVQPLLTKYNKPLIFTEIGYRSVHFAAMRPWDFNGIGSVDLAIQKDLYTAMFEYWKTKPYFGGLHLWDWKVEPNAGGTNNADYTPQNKPAENVLTTYFGNVDTLGTQPAQLILNNYYVASVGAQTYTDRTYTIQNLPDYLTGKPLLRTKNDDKLSNLPNYLTFTITKPAAVYVAFDARATQVPNWLSTWQKETGQIVTSDTAYNLYAKNFVAGEVVLGGNAALPMVGAKSNYFVLASENLLPANDPKPIEPTPIDPTPIDPIIPPVPEPTPEPTPEPDPLPIPEPTTTYTLTIDTPENNAEMSGEKKIKVVVGGLTLGEYYATYNVDNKGAIEMVDAVTGDFKQAKIEFDEWTWSDAGPYNVEIKAYDLFGKLLDTKNLTLYVK